MLHLINQSPIILATLERISSGDDVVFLESAVWNALCGHELNTQFNTLIDNTIQLYVLEDELIVAGIDPEQLMAGVAVIDYSGLVELTVKNKVIKTWR